MNLQDMSSCWVTFNVREKDYQRMSEGKIIDAFIPALNNKAIKLKIRSAKDLGSFAAWKATKMRGEYDSKTFEIKADPVEHVDGLIPGMTSCAEVRQQKGLTLIKRKMEYSLIH